MKDFYSLIKIDIDVGNIKNILLTVMKNKVFTKKKINSSNKEFMKSIIELMKEIIFILKNSKILEINISSLKKILKKIKQNFIIKYKKNKI